MCVGGVGQIHRVDQPRVRGRRRVEVVGHTHLGGLDGTLAASEALQGAARAAGIRDVRFRDLRHTVGTRMAAAGVPADPLGVDGPPRLQDDTDLRGLRADRAPARAG